MCVFVGEGLLFLFFLLLLFFKVLVTTVIEDQLSSLLQFSLKAAIRADAG